MKDTIKDKENTSYSYQDRIKKAKEILSNSEGEPNIGIESALEFLDQDELRYLLYSMKDITRYIAFSKPTAGDDREEALQGAIRINSWIAEEVEKRMEKQGFCENIDEHLN